MSLGYPDGFINDLENVDIGLNALGPDTIP
jgi:hypothetical protein